jgi:hypothetical protein
MLGGDLRVFAREDAPDPAEGTCEIPQVTGRPETSDSGALIQEDDSCCSYPSSWL